MECQAGRQRRPRSREDGMTPRTTLPAVSQIAVLAAARPLSTGNLLADCERWCREHFPRAVPVRTAPVHG